MPLGKCVQKALINLQCYFNQVDLCLVRPSSLSARLHCHMVGIAQRNLPVKKFTRLLSFSTHSPLQHNLSLSSSLIWLCSRSFKSFQLVATNPRSILSCSGDSGHHRLLPRPPATIDQVTQCTVKGKQHFLLLWRGPWAARREADDVTDIGWQTLWTQTTGN